MSKDRNIVLVGMMGTGKSTVGKALAEAWGWTFVDSDQAIVDTYGKSISDMFAAEGEAVFRERESATVARIMEGSRQVVATGGGAVLAEANRSAMKENGTVVALTASAAAIIERVRADEGRPLLQGDVEERVHAILAVRKHAYDFADVKVDTDHQSADEIVAYLDGQLRQS